MTFDALSVSNFPHVAHRVIIPTALASGSEINLSADRINNYQPLPSVGKIGRQRSRSPELLKRPSFGPLGPPLAPISHGVSSMSSPPVAASLFTTVFFFFPFPPPPPFPSLFSPAFSPPAPDAGRPQSADSAPPESPMPPQSLGDSAADEQPARLDRRRSSSLTDLRSSFDQGADEVEAAEAEGADDLSSSSSASSSPRLAPAPSPAVAMGSGVRGSCRRSSTSPAVSSSLTRETTLSPPTSGAA